MPTRPPFSDQEYKYVATDFGNIAYRQAGSGPVVIVGHGVLLNGQLWDSLSWHLADVRRCIAVDLLARGATRACTDQGLSFDAQAGMLAAFCRAMKFASVDVVANDTGGGIAQIFAARHPARIRSLALTDCDTHNNWPPKQAEPLHRLAKPGGLVALCQRLLYEGAVSRTNFCTCF